ncbi:putative F-box/FBD/LRR-repeat protein At1g78760 [Quercus suber]|uniref:putative F-box/FBD/LRR-repeat protein At1g78760 n=1 Tax=Quercus suber TaxID=58331 RepID=UPI0032DE5988
MEEESNGSSERSSTSSEESAPYFPHQSTDNSSHGINSQEEEESSDDHRNKRRKHAPVSEEDRISTLPDSILLKILSSLCIKDAVVTGVLSKRWAFLWTSVPSLRFTHTYFISSVYYANAVDNVLLLHRALKLTNFSVQFQYMPDLKPRINLWVRFATTAKVDQPSLVEILYANEFVSELDFRLCKIKPTGLVRWSSLKRLCFGYVPLREDVFNRLDIVSESLKKLVIDCYPAEPDLGDLELEIVAPKIESLEIIGDFFSMAKFQIKNASALVEVRVDFEIPMEYEDEEQEYHYKDCENVVRELFESLHQVKKFIVGKWCLMVVSS